MQRKVRGADSAMRASQFREKTIPPVRESNGNSENAGNISIHPTLCVESKFTHAGGKARLNMAMTENDKRQVLAGLNGRTQMMAFEAATAIWRDPDPSLERPLISILTHGRRPLNRAAAAFAMQILKTQRGVKALERSVKNRSEHPRVRGEAAEALAHGHRKMSHDVLLK